MTTPAAGQPGALPGKLKQKRYGTVMTTEAALLQAIVDNPGDEALWLILADWLDEHDDPKRAELLRLHRKLITTCSEPEKHPERAAWHATIVRLLTEGVRPSVPQRKVRLAEGVDIGFAFIPPGSFLMGSPEGEEGRRDDEGLHRVTLTRGFWMARTPVTQAQWRAVLGSNPSHFQGEDLPVEQVSWEDCQEYCSKLGERVGNGFRLPSEAEWEYSCRAATTTPFFGKTLSTEQANYDGTHPYGGGTRGEYRKKTTAVGSFACNGWGLFDLHGNVWRWCQDRSGEYGKRPVRDPQGPKRGSTRVLRGGSWDSYADRCRAAYRSWVAPAYRNLLCGCRVVLCLD